MGNYGASVIGQSVWREKEGPEEEVLEMEKETRKKKIEFRPTQTLEPDLGPFCLSSPALIRWSGRPLTSRTESDYVTEMTHIFSNIIFQQGLGGSQVRLIL